MNTTKLTIHFNGDPSVGIFSYSFTMEIPSHALEDGNKGYTLKRIREFYAELDGEFSPVIYIDGEHDDSI